MKERWFDDDFPNPEDWGERDVAFTRAKKTWARLEDLLAAGYTWVRIGAATDLLADCGADLLCVMDRRSNLPRRAQHVLVLAWVLDLALGLGLVGRALGPKVVANARALTEYRQLARVVRAAASEPDQRAFGEAAVAVVSLCDTRPDRLVALHRYLNDKGWPNALDEDTVDPRGRPVF